MYASEPYILSIGPNKPNTGLKPGVLRTLTDPDFEVLYVTTKYG